MRVRIQKTVTTLVDVDVALPYYYRQQINLDTATVMVYGKIEATVCTVITLKTPVGGDTETFAEVSRKLQPPAFSGSYFEPEYASTEEAYLTAKKNAEALLALA